MAVFTTLRRQARKPGQKWNATDAIIDPTLPGKRLIWAAGGDFYVVHYQRSGIAHTFNFWLPNSRRMTRNPKQFGLA